MTSKRLILVIVALVGLRAQASQLDELVAAIGGGDDRARSVARQLIVREDPVDAVPKLLPLLASEKVEVWTAAFNVLSDITAEVGVAGREAQRTAIAGNLMTLVAADQPEPIKLLGLRLLPRAVPAGYDITPIARLLDDEKLREKTRVALEEMHTPEACAAIRTQLAKADPAFQCALLNSLAVLKDNDSIAHCEPLLRSSDAKVRAAAIRSIAWTGDFQFLKLAEPKEADRSETMDAYLRLLNTVADKNVKRQLAVEGFLNLLKSAEPLVKEAALTGLGRWGDANCVPPILETIKGVEGRTYTIGINALQSIQDDDAVRAIIAAYSTADVKIQLALIPVLGAKRDPLAASILEGAVKSGDSAYRLAGLQAVADAAIPESADILSKAASDGDNHQKAVARLGLLQVADTLRRDGKPDNAGKVYVRAFTAAGGDKEIAQKAAEGLLGCPVPEGYDVCKMMAGDKDAGEFGTKLLLGVAGALAQAKQKDKAIELYDLVAQRNPGIDTMREVARAMVASGASVDLHHLLGVITKWWVVGPFDIGANNEGWEVDYVGEPAVSLVAKYMSGKKRVNWTEVTSKDPNGLIDLLGIVAQIEHCIGYIYTEIDVPQATDAVLLIGSDDGVKIWVNGQKVHDKFVSRGLQVDQDRVPIKLEAGANKILVKIWQNTGGWVFCGRLSLPDGRPVTFTQAK